MPVEDLAPGCDDERAAELEDVLLGGRTALAAAREEALDPADDLLRSGDVEKFAARELDRAMGLAPAIDEEGERDVLLLLEVGGHRGQAHSDGGDVRALELLVPVTQLRDVLAAERSAVVTEPDEDGGPVLPEGAEPDLTILMVDEDDVLEGGRSLHGADGTASCVVAAAESHVSRRRGPRNHADVRTLCVGLRRLRFELLRYPQLVADDPRVVPPAR